MSPPMMEGDSNPLELALQQLAKTMGVSIPTGPSDENTKKDENQLPTKIEATTGEEEEEGEVTEEPPPKPNRSVPPQKTKKTIKPIRKIIEYTGEVDAESLMRGPTSS